MNLALWHGIRLPLHGQTQSSRCPALVSPVVFPAYSSAWWLQAHTTWKGQSSSVPLVLPHRVWDKVVTQRALQINQVGFAVSQKKSFLHLVWWTEFSDSSFPVFYKLTSVQSLPFSRKLWLAKLFSDNFSWKLPYYQLPNKSLSSPSYMCEIKPIVLVQFRRLCRQGEITFLKPQRSWCITAGRTTSTSYRQEFNAKLKGNFLCYSLACNKSGLCHRQLSLQWAETWGQHVMVSRLPCCLCWKQALRKIGLCRHTA